MHSPALTEAAVAAPAPPGHARKLLLRRFSLSLPDTIPVVLMASPMGDLLDMSRVPGALIVAPVFSVLVTSPREHFPRRSSRQTLQHCRGVVTLGALAMTATLLARAAFPYEERFYWELTTLIVVMLLRQWLEIGAVGSAQRALEALAALLLATAERLEPDGRISGVPVLSCGRERSCSSRQVVGFLPTE